jgi:hypothetical protein
MDICIVRYITEDGFLIMNWVVSRHFYVIQFWEGDIDGASVCGLRRVLEKSLHIISLIQLWIIYIGGLGGGGAGGTGCQMATGFSVLIFAISLIVTSRLSEHKAKLNIIFTINILY